MSITTTYDIMKLQRNLFGLINLIIILIYPVMNQAANPIRPPFYAYENDAWVDSVFQSLSFDEKIGQLITVAAYSNRDESHTKEILQQIAENKIGGLVFFQGGPIRQARLTNEYQQASKVPLLIGIDAENGLGQRLDSCISYPVAMAIGAVQDDSLVYQMGKDVGQQCQRMGIQVNFAPVADVNNNPKNPIIGYRSYGQDVENVTRKAMMYALGMQEENILPTAKHFPGHGDTEKDSHKTLPVIPFDRARMDSVEIMPFHRLIYAGIGGIMVGHLDVPALDSTGTPASLSKTITGNLLHDELEFKGLTVTDAMNMNGAKVDGPPGTADVMALAAGNDVLEFVTDPKAAIKAIKKAVKKGKITKEEIDQKCRKVLMVKRWAGLNTWKPVKTDSLSEDLQNPQYQLTARELAKESLTLLQNKGNLLPLQRLDTLHIATVSIGRDYDTVFQNELGEYMEMDHFHIDKNASPEELQELLPQLKNYNLVIASVNNFWMTPEENFHLTQLQLDATNIISKMNNSVIVLFGNAYAANAFSDLNDASSVIMAYQETDDAESLAAQLIFGAIPAKGKLPVTLNQFFPAGTGIQTKALGRFAYTIPEAVGIDSHYLEQRIDSLVNIGLSQKAYPGCQILLAKNGKIFFHKCYGYRTYNDQEPVKPTDIYDFASLTKVTGPLPALMKLADEGKFNVDEKLSKYWPEWDNTNKANISIRDILAHQGQLEAWIPYWKSIVKPNGRFKHGYIRHRPTRKYSLRVSDRMYLNHSFIDTIYSDIDKSPLLPKKEYVYSGLTFYLYPQIIANLTGEDYQKYIHENFYGPLGASTVTYNPYLKYPINRMIPTENDTFFRHQQIQGFVHDEGAAMMGGVSGNAGLFGTINDAAKIFQMYLNYGSYGGKRYVSEATMKEWTRCQFPENDNRRGLGFDKPLIDNSEKTIDEAYPAPSCSPESFGHSGFTGTFAWVDPENGLLFMFFSNRVYPTRNDRKLYELNLRPRLHQVVYDALKRGLKSTENSQQHVLKHSQESETNYPPAENPPF